MFWTIGQQNSASTSWCRHLLDMNSVLNVGQSTLCTHLNAPGLITHNPPLVACRFPFPIGRSRRLLSCQIGEHVDAVQLQLLQASWWKSFALQVKMFPSNRHSTCVDPFAIKCALCQSIDPSNLYFCLITHLQQTHFLPTGRFISIHGCFFINDL